MVIFIFFKGWVFRTQSVPIFFFSHFSPAFLIFTGNWQLATGNFFEYFLVADGDEADIVMLFGESADIAGKETAEAGFLFELIDTALDTLDRTLTEQGVEAGFKKFAVEAGAGGGDDRDAAGGGLHQGIAAAFAEGGMNQAVDLRIKEFAHLIVGDLGVLIEGGAEFDGGSEIGDGAADEVVALVMAVFGVGDIGAEADDERGIVGRRRDGGPGGEVEAAGDEVDVVVNSLGYFIEFTVGGDEAGATAHFPEQRFKVGGMGEVVVAAHAADGFQAFGELFQQGDVLGEDDVGFAGLDRGLVVHKDPFDG